MVNKKKRSLKKKRWGFTLVELMVVITLSMLMLTGVTVSLNNYYDKEKLDQSTTRLGSLLELSRTYALTSQKPTGYGNSLDYVGVTVTSDGKVTAAAGSKISGVGTTYFSESLSDRSLVVTAVNQGTLNFAAGSGKLVDATGMPLSGAASVSINLKLAGSSDSRTTVVNSLGKVGTAEGFSVNYPTSTPVPTATPTMIQTGAPTSPPTSVPTHPLPTATNSPTWSPPTATPTLGAAGGAPGGGGVISTPGPVIEIM